MHPFNFLNVLHDQIFLQFKHYGQIWCNPYYGFEKKKCYFLTKLVTLFCIKYVPHMFLN